MCVCCQGQHTTEQQRPLRDRSTSISRLYYTVCPVYKFMLFTARCYAERGIATASRPSVRYVEVLRSGWNSSNIISSLFGWKFTVCRPQHHGPTPKRTPEILVGIRAGYGKSGFRRTKALISLKRGKIIARHSLVTDFCSVDEMHSYKNNSQKCVRPTWRIVSDQHYSTAC